VAVLFTVGVSAAQAAIVVRGRGVAYGTPSVGHSGTNVGLVVAGVVILALVLGGIVYAIVADRRLVTPAVVATGSTPLSDRSSEAEQPRKAA
jgi:hypothetical protein